MKNAVIGTKADFLRFMKERKPEIKTKNYCVLNNETWIFISMDYGVCRGYRFKELYINPQISIDYLLNGVLSCCTEETNIEWMKVNK